MRTSICCEDSPPTGAWFTPFKLEDSEASVNVSVRRIKHEHSPLGRERKGEIAWHTSKEISYHRYDYTIN